MKNVSKQILIKKRLFHSKFAYFFLCNFNVSSLNKKELIYFGDEHLKVDKETTGQNCRIFQNSPDKNAENFNLNS